MKRAKALINLSRDHHKALVTAKQIKTLKADSDSEISNYWDAKREIIRSELEQHFTEEERALSPLLLESAEHLNQRIISDHNELLRLLSSKNIDDALQFSELLKAHVRFEERELFPWLQNQYTESELSDAF